VCFCECALIGAYLLVRPNSSSSLWIEGIRVSKTRPGWPRRPTRTSLNKALR
jgi:hypothetical protein